jgi:hypothetical protein
VGGQVRSSPRIREAQPAKISGLRQRLFRTAALKDTFEFRTHKVSDTQAELYARFTVPS